MRPYSLATPPAIFHSDEGQDGSQGYSDSGENVRSGHRGRREDAGGGGRSAGEQRTRQRGDIGEARGSKVAVGNAAAAARRSVGKAWPDLSLQGCRQIRGEKE
jgi:hypothetical protein